MDERELCEIEISLILEALFLRYGYDFRAYSRATISRRLRQFISEPTTPGSIAAVIPRLLTDEQFATELIQYFSVSVTEMFRDPSVYCVLRAEVIPLLRTYPHVKIWHAGCATGEEVYSMAIVLQEEGLADRVTLFGTDFNDTALQQAKAAIYPLDRVQSYTRNYQLSGGQRSFSEYYHANYNGAVLDTQLKRHIAFANHNLVTDGVFGEMHLILCRNVMIYFTRELQTRALQLFTQSLVRGGFLCLGSREDLQFSAVCDQYDVLNESARIYRKRAS